jgi:hypothetical protein
LLSQKDWRGPNCLNKKVAADAGLSPDRMRAHADRYHVATDMLDAAKQHLADLRQRGAKISPDEADEQENILEGIKIGLEEDLQYLFPAIAVGRKRLEEERAKPKLVHLPGGLKQN